MKLKPLVITISIIVSIVTSSFSFADNYVFRHALHNISGNIGEEDGQDNSGKEEAERGIRKPINLEFKTNNTEISGNVYAKGEVTSYNEVGTKLGSATSSYMGDFTVSIGNSVIAGDTIKIVAKDSNNEEFSTIKLKSTACYDPSNVGDIGTEYPCKGMFIANNSLLKSVASGSKYNTYGNETYTLSKDGVDYTFSNSEHNIFTGQVTDIEDLFSKTDFNGDIGYWDTSNIKNMNGVFNGAGNFNQDIGDWDTSNVNDMSAMFYLLKSNPALNISKWDVSNVKDMNMMFWGSYMKPDLSKWETTSLENTSHMFRDTSYNKDISGWDMSNVTNMRNMFQDNSYFNQDISNWDTSNVVTMAEVFRDARNFNQDIGGWETGKVTDMGFMFNNARSFSYSLSSWDTSNVVDMRRMFEKAYDFNQDLSHWCVPKVAKDYSSHYYFADHMSEDKHPVWGECPKN